MAQCGWQTGMLLSTVWPRMWNWIVLSLTVFIGLVHPTYSSQIASEDLNSWETSPMSKTDGIRIQIEKNFRLKQALPTRELYRIAQTAINEANPAHLGLGVREINLLSRDVVNTAQCYGIDPVIFTSLIWRESNFKPAAYSERGAAGLTQMTHIGIQEVLERLSPTSPRRLGKLRALVKQCNPRFLKRVPGELSADTLSAWKNSVAFSTNDALVMGALLFKINLASSRPETRLWGKIGTYEEALRRYNGDPQIKAQFARDVLMLAKRMMEIPEVALNDSKFLSQIRGL